MKKIMMMAAIVSVVSCNNGSTKNEQNDSVKVSNDVTYAYPINYSSKFEMADPEKGKKITELWKDFDDNKMDNHSNYFADTIGMDFPGMGFKGSRDSMVAMTKGYRSSLGTVSSNVDAVMSVRSTDKNEDWVLIWGIEHTTSAAGKSDSAHLHEIWRFNKDGKIDYMSQYRQDYPGKK